MVERFVESLAIANDSSTFDTSLEVKPLITRKRSKCITELDREELARFVTEFKQRNNINNDDYIKSPESSNISLSKSFLMPKSNYNTPMATPRRRKSLNISSNILLKHKVYENSIIAASTPLYLTEKGPSKVEIEGSPLPIRNLVKILENSLPKLIINPPTPIGLESSESKNNFPTTSSATSIDYSNPKNSSSSSSSAYDNNMDNKNSLINSSNSISGGDTISTDSDLGYSEHDYCDDYYYDNDNDNNSTDNEYYEELEINHLNDENDNDKIINELLKTPKNHNSNQNRKLIKNRNDNENQNSFKKPSSSLSCSTSKVDTIRNFITSAHKKVKDLKNGGGSSSSCNSSRTSSPVLLRAKNFLHMGGIRPLSKINNNNNIINNNYNNNNNNYHNNNNGDGTSCDSDADDGISSTSSQNISANSSFEMQPPIVPVFKVTPPLSFRRSNPAYELARILRGSFRGSLRTKRASIATLRRSLSDPDQYQLNDILAQGACGSFEQKTDMDNLENEELFENKSEDNVYEEKFSKVDGKTERSGLRDTFIKNLDNIRSRALPSTNSSPFRRWGQSSFRTVRTTPDQRPTISRRPSSLAASENDVYTKSMDDFINDDVNSIHSHSDGGADIQIGRTKALAINFLNAINAQQNNSNNNHNIHLPTNSSNKFSSNHRVQIWGNSFEKLLEDPAGLHTFAEFLKKEFSAENIYFWTACERYHHINDDNERAQKAIEIYSKHLGTGACEPVNVDSQARSLAEEKLESADRNIFNYAQKQIYNLMKFDSYQRFIRSDLYKKCLEAEAKNQPLPYTGENLSDSLKTSNMLNSPGPSKLKKSASNAEDRRRKSLLPWHRKVRCKSRDRTNNNNDNGVADNNSEINPLSKSQSSSGNTLKLPHTNSTSDIHSSRSSLSSFDANTCLTSNPNTAFNSGSEESKRNFCRVIFSDGAATVTLTRPDQTVRQLIERLLEKRGFKYQFFDVILSPNGKALDLDSSSNILMSKEVQVEQRIAFKLDLPDPKVISVKSKPKKALCDVLKPILQKYNYRFEDVQILMRDTHEQIELSLPVTAIDGQRLSVVLLRNGNNLWKQQQLQKRNGLLLTTSSCSPIATAAVPDTYQHNLGAISKSYLPSNKNNLLSVPKSLGIQSNHQSTLDEITNKVFTEVLQGKVDSQENNMPKSVDLCSLRSDECASESSSIYDQTKFRDLNAATAKNFIKPKKPLTINTTSKFNVEKTQTSNSITTQTDENLNVNNNNNNSTNNNMQSSNSNLTGIKKPLIAKWKTGVKLQVTARAHNQEEFLEGLKRAQRARLEDQRGTEINFELPDFLKDKANLSAANKLRKIRANLNPITNHNSNIISGGNLVKTTSNNGNETTNRNSLDSSKDRPQPAPRLSITKSASSIAITSNRTHFGATNNTKNNSNINSDNNDKNNNSNTNTSISYSNTKTGNQQKDDENIIGNDNSSSSNTSKSIENLSSPNSSIVDFNDDVDNNDNNITNLLRGPPPLPPKPKILPIKPSNWGQNASNQTNILQLSQSATTIADLIPARRALNNNEISSAKNAYLDQPSSSFV
ncbi:regulator of G-protein signaling loco isoform X2 [Condylostylus longicornis]|uniref:regulator of G-protein signaling loco isoform X2 n=1 Tax=Condylostylus longicornis TaxID=2530218 RepID=UPI00244E1781|nr:regulator of G-protein signaling loco isoform X2 [Condylostylus longicornis]